MGVHDGTERNHETRDERTKTQRLGLGGPLLKYGKTRGTDGLGPVFYKAFKRHISIALYREATKAYEFML